MSSFGSIFNKNVQSCSNDIEIAHNSGDKLAYWGNNHLNLIPLYLAAAADGGCHEWAVALARFLILIVTTKNI
jgi:hypothetical protein